MTDLDTSAPFRLVLDTVSKALDAIVPTTPPDVIIAGLILAASSLAVAVEGTEENFVEGCRAMFKIAEAGKDRAEG